jgi:hypothetical protein
MKPLGIPIRLDRPRTLLLDEAAFHLIARTTGVNLAEIMRSAMETFMKTGVDTFTLTVDVVRVLVWAGCRHEDRRLSFSTVAALITDDNHPQFHDDIVKALLRGFGVSYSPAS